MSDQHTPNNGDQNHDQSHGRSHDQSQGQMNDQTKDLLMDTIIDRILAQGDADNQHVFADDLDADTLQAEMERVAATVDMAAATAKPVDVPVGLGDRLMAQVDAYPAQISVNSSETATARVSKSRVSESLSIQDAPQPVIARIRRTPWVIAAASLLLATVAIIGRGPVPGPAAQDLGADRLALIAETPEGELTQWDWISTDDAAVVGEVIGDVVWSDTLNTGYMRISGLAINDPSLKQYQLWIFDATRASGDLPQFGDGLLSQRPIDGGVFDINAQGEVIIEIDAKLQVQQAAAFAITIEPPGGVVVSDRSRVPLLALAP